MNLSLLLIPPTKPLLPTVRPASLRSAGRPAADRQDYEGVQHEVIGNQAKYGDRAGITATDFDRFVALNDQHGHILKQLPAVTKAVEVLTESLVHVDNQRHRLAAQFGKAAESHADLEGGDPTLRTAYEKTVAYRSIIADKAVKTRQKNEEAKKTAGEATDAVAPAQPTAPAGATGATEGTAKPGPSISRIPNPPPDNIFTID